MVFIIAIRTGSCSGTATVVRRGFRRCRRAVRVESTVGNEFPMFERGGVGRRSAGLGEFLRWETCSHEILGERDVGRGGGRITCWTGGRRRGTRTRFLLVIVIVFSVGGIIIEHGFLVRFHLRLGWKAGLSRVDSLLTGSNRLGTSSSSSLRRLEQRDYLLVIGEFDIDRRCQIQLNERIHRSSRSTLGGFGLLIHSRAHRSRTEGRSPTLLLAVRGSSIVNFIVGLIVGHGSFVVLFAFQSGGGSDSTVTGKHRLFGETVGHVRGVAGVELVEVVLVEFL